MTGIPLKKLVYPLAVCIVLSAALFAQSQEELKARRDKVLSQMPSNSVMILQSRGSHTAFLTESQDGNFFYLTGIDESDAFLVLSKIAEPWARPSSGTGGQEAGRTIMFSLPVSERRAAWDAQPLGMEGIKKLGFEDVRPSSEFEDFFDRLLLREIDILYMDIATSRPYCSRPRYIHV